MKRISVFGTALVIGALGAAQPSEAQTYRPFEVGLAGGLSVPTGELADFFKTGYHVQGSVGVRTPLDRLGVRLDGAYTRMAEQDHDDHHIRYLTGSLNGVYRLAAGPARPYLIGGLGVYNSKLGADDDDHDHADSHTDFGLNLGGGFEFALGGLAAFVEARIHNIFTEHEAERILPITIGFRL